MHIKGLRPMSSIQINKPLFGLATLNFENYIYNDYVSLASPVDCKKMLVKTFPTPLLEKGQTPLSLFQTPPFQTLVCQSFPDE
jgi:hypothetical protein